MLRSSNSDTRKRRPRVISRHKILEPSFGKFSKPTMLQSVRSSNRPSYVPQCKATSGASYSRPRVKRVYQQLGPSQQHPGGRNSRKSSVLLSPHSSTTLAPSNLFTCTLRVKFAQQRFRPARTIFRPLRSTRRKRSNPSSSNQSLATSTTIYPNQRPKGGPTLPDFINTSKLRLPSSPRTLKTYRACLINPALSPLRSWTSKLKSLQARTSRRTSSVRTFCCYLLRWNRPL